MPSSTLPLVLYLAVSSARNIVFLDLSIVMSSFGFFPLKYHLLTLSPNDPTFPVHSMKNATAC